MPVSSPKGKDIIKAFFEKQTDIKIITDLGPGSGTYPKLLGGNYIWKAVEIWGPYIKHFGLDQYYQEIRIGDIRYMDIPKSDCVIFGDVLEHIPKIDAIKTFKRIEKQFKHAVVSIPVCSFSQCVYEGNEFERHISTWTYSELEALIPDTFKIRERIHPLAVFIK